MTEVSNTLKFRIPGVSVSMNNIYGIVKRYKTINVFMTPEARAVKERILTFTPLWKFDREVKPVFSLTAHVFDNWIRKDRLDMIVKDVDNMGKIIQDGIFSRLGVNDKYVVDKRVIKRQQDKEPYIDIILKILGTYDDWIKVHTPNIVGEYGKDMI